MLLSPDLREWLPEDHLAWLVLDVVAELDLSVITSRFRLGSTGREAYDPGMLTALLIYGYCQGVRSSRAIERACVTDVAFRVIAAQQRPDHTTLARFRAGHAAALADLLGQVLAVCGRAGMGRVGVVAMDGTKIAGQASPHKNYTAARFRKMAADIVDEAGDLDAEEDALFGEQRGDELSKELMPGGDRASRIGEGLRQLKAEHAGLVAADVEMAEGKLVKARRQAVRERDWVEHRPHQSHALKPERRRRRVPMEDQARVKHADRRVLAVEAELAAAQASQGRRATAAALVRNLSDPDTRAMFVRGKGFLQGFNAQLAVSDDHLILATDVTADANDGPSFVPMMNQAVNNVAEHLGGEIKTLVADAAYCTMKALTAPGPDRLIATGHSPDIPKRPSTNEHIVKMAARLKVDSPDRTIYQRRQATVEPVIGQLKDRLGLRRFSRRGLEAAKHELALAATAYNIRRLASA